MKRICKKCNEEKELITFPMYTDKKGRKGYRWDCAECEAKYKANYYNTHRERHLENHKKWYAEKGPELLAKKRAAYIPHGNFTKKPLVYIDGMRVCSRCKVGKNESDFQNDRVRNGKKIRRGVCKKCLNIEKRVIFNKNPEYHRNLKNINARKNYKRTEKLKKYGQEWAHNNREHLKDLARERRKKNPEKAREKDKRNYYSNINNIIKNNKKRIDELSDNYVKRLLIIKGFPKHKITKDLIETHRLIIKMKRLCQTQN